MYVERQMGNQCRRHALNAFFQGGILQWGDIEKHAVDFESFYNIPSTDRMKNDYDFFNADGSSLLTWVASALLPERFFLVLPCGNIKEWLETIGISSVDRCVDDDPRVMVFSADHVYTMIRKGTEWYVLDSLSPTPYVYPMERIVTDNSLGMIVSLSASTASQVAFQLEKNIATFLNKFSGLHSDTVQRILSNGRLGDAHDKLENWVFTRLRILAWLRGANSRTKRLFQHINQMDKFTHEKNQNKLLLSYGVVFS